MESTDFNSTCSVLDRKEHIKKLSDGLTKVLPEEYAGIVSAQTWTVFWISHSLVLLGQKHFLPKVGKDVIKFICECEHPGGGYGGGPGQLAHLATTFAAVNAVITLDSEEAFDSINRLKLLNFIRRMKQPDGSFAMHEDGEIDSRATYCALALLKVLNIHDERLLVNVADWILSCQTYEGGFGATPGNEAHGGYTFCCVASLCLLNSLHEANIQSLLRWLTFKQLEADGGFCGRSNKLVDSCYSYWQGAVFPLIHKYLKSEYKNEKKTHKMTEEVDQYSELNGPWQERVFKRRNSSLISDSWMFDCEALQDYILNKCQAKSGLLRDKPGVQPDFYHTCYALSGFSISQHQPDGSIIDIGQKPINKIEATHPLLNLTIESLNDCLEYYKNKRIEVEIKNETR